MNKSKKNKKQKQKRVFNQLSLNDRVKIEVKYRDGWSLRKIADILATVEQQASSVEK